MSVLLIYPPTAKISEPPPGIARLAGALRDQGISCLTVDLNLECMLEQFTLPIVPGDTWSRRAFKARDSHLAELRSAGIYTNPDRYRRAVRDLTRLLSIRGSASSCDITLANYTDRNLSPLVSSELLKAAECFRENHFYPCFSARLEILMETYAPEIVGISFSFLSQALTGAAILGFIRQRYPAVTTVAGGGLITSWLNSPHQGLPIIELADHLVSGPGEQALLGILGKPQTRKMGRPDYRTFACDHYLSPGMILPYAASHGCYWKKCTFCPDRAENNCYQQNSPAVVGSELADLIQRHQPILIHFLDNAISPELLRYLALSPPGPPWYGFTRIEKDLEDISFCEALRQSGCIMLKLGLESGSQEVLDLMHKGIELSRVARVLENLSSVGIATYVYLLFGTPGETEREAIMTMDFVRKHHRAVTFLNLAIFNMPVCSPEAKDISGRFSAGDLSLYCDFPHPQGWDRKSVRTFLQTRFKKDPLIGPIVRRDPPTFTSNHAPLFLLAQKSGARNPST